MCGCVSEYMLGYVCYVVITLCVVCTHAHQRDRTYIYTMHTPTSIPAHTHTPYIRSPTNILTYQHMCRPSYSYTDTTVTCMRQQHTCMHTQMSPYTHAYTGSHTYIRTYAYHIYQQITPTHAHAHTHITVTNARIYKHHPSKHMNTRAYASSTRINNHSR